MDMKYGKKLGAAAAALTLAALLASCGATASTDRRMVEGKSSYNDMFYAETTRAPMTSAASYLEYYPEIVSDSSYYPSDEAGASDILSENERKIITTCRIHAETKDFDSAIAGIEAGIQEQGGYIESSNVSGTSLSRSGYALSRYASYTLRVPASRLKGYVAGLEGLFNITSKSQDADDISDTYYDTQARLESYQIQEQRLLAMLEKSDDLQSLLQLEDKLSEVRYQIERLTATMNRYDSMVSYSTVYLELSEVVEYTEVEEPITFGERMGTAFSSSWHEFAENWKTFCVEITYALPAILVFVVAAVVILIVVRVCVKRRRKKDSTIEAEKKDKE